MAYIRSTGNPEAMYIWGEADGNVTVMKGSKTIGTIPTDVFDGLINKYVDDNCPDDCEYKGAMIDEVWIPVPTERITDEMKMLSMASTPMVRLSYENWSVDMWDVTWYYIAHSNSKR